MKLAINLAIVTVPFVLIWNIGCAREDNSNDKNSTKNITISEENLSYRNKSLYSETGVAESIPNSEYSKEIAGTSKKIGRAFDNAPPMIPHDIEGMYPITQNNNACLTCHHPDVAKDINATPLPKTHFTNFRPNVKVEKDGKFVEEVNVMNNKLVKHELNDMYQGRFNCSQCHAPQAQLDPLVESQFNGGFRNENGKESSNLINTMNEGL
jgi:cytochrome c-type protein NapB